MPGRSKGMTLIELLIIVALITLLSAMAVPVVSGFVERGRIDRAIDDIRTASMKIYEWRSHNAEFPGTLAQADIEMPLDPWGRPYAYTNIATAQAGEVRRDSELRRVNSDFDLYSVGPDGQTTMGFDGAKARDDIVRASNGGHIGLAEDYD
jgi:general secretion pathway protein G